MLIGHWGVCDPQECAKNALYTQDEHRIALETNELIRQYKASDATNDKLDASFTGTSTTNDCPCVKPTQCKRMAYLFQNLALFSKSHPERKGIITYIRSKICPGKNQVIRCCGTQLDDNGEEIKPTPPSPPPSGPTDKVCCNFYFSAF